MSCTETILDNENFGPKYSKSFVNYSQFVVKCPSNCLKTQQRAVGLGIHPEDSPVCINAIIDRAIPVYGGKIILSIHNGLKSYTGNKKLYKTLLN